MEPRPGVHKNPAAHPSDTDEKVSGRILYSKKYCTPNKGSVPYTYNLNE